MKDDVIQEALKWVGYLEKKSDDQLENFTANAGNNNYTIFSKWYRDWWGDNYQAQPWCAVFICCVFKLALDTELFPHFAYCPTGVNNFKKAGQWLTGNPNPGDIIFFEDGTGEAYHVGIVERTDAKYVYTIEGNTSSAAGVVANGGSVARKSYSLGYNKILGYGRPDYESSESQATAYPSVLDVTNELIWRGIIKNQELWNSRAASDDDIRWLFVKYYPYIIKNGGSVKNPLSVQNVNEALTVLTKQHIVAEPDKWIEKTAADEDLVWLLVKMADYIN